MNSHLVVYGRHVTGSAYVDLIVALEGLDEFAEVLDVGYLVRSDRSADQLLTELLDVVGSDQPLVVLPVGAGAVSGVAPAPVRAWFS